MRAKLNRQRVAPSMRLFSSRVDRTAVDPKIAEGKYGHTLKDKHMEAHEYNPLVQPKMFTELTSQSFSEDPLDQAIE